MIIVENGDNEWRLYPFRQSDLSNAAGEWILQHRKLTAMSQVHEVQGFPKVLVAGHMVRLLERLAVIERTMPE